MDITVEPRDGPQLERLITPLLNVTGVMRRVIATTEHPLEASGTAVIGLAAEWIHDALVLLAEHRSDQELALATELLAEITVLVGSRLGLRDHFAEG
jgi:hypothetical protein